ncbi:MAG: adenosylcobinamide-GDP ribazoletransferase [Sulfitobacter sp.]|jgi:adenosylcobinamide-GDP ribazoletransferase
MPVSDRFLDPRDPRIALGLLSRLPFGADLQVAARRGAACAWAFPLVGLVVGAIAALIGAVALILGVSPGPVAVLVVAAQVMLTGGMHEDGLADSADGLWGGWEPARRLEIMTDSHIGAYGVIALALGLILRVMALALLASLGVWALIAGVLAAALISRASIVTVMTLLSPARENGLSASVGQPGVTTLGLAWIMAGIGALGLIGLAAVPAALLAIAVTLGVMRIAKVRIGGQTGDILGASQQMAEIAVLMVLTVGV